MNIKKWYAENFEDDYANDSLSPDATFEGLFKALEQHEDVYEYLGVGDSLIRENVFSKLSEIKGIDYSVIYNLWLSSCDY
jgi:hypothetical protein